MLEKWDRPMLYGGLSQNMIMKWVICAPIIVYLLVRVVALTCSLLQCTPLLRSGLYEREVPCFLIAFTVSS